MRTIILYSSGSQIVIPGPAAKTVPRNLLIILFQIRSTETETLELGQAISGLIIGDVNF